MRGLAVLASITDRILTLPTWLVLALVFAFPALEASAFVGFVFPGEIAVILGGVAASRGTVPLWAVIAAAVSGAIIGDSLGYLIGRRWGTHLLHGTICLPRARRRHARSPQRRSGSHVGEWVSASRAEPFLAVREFQCRRGEMLERKAIMEEAQCRARERIPGDVNPTWSPFAALYAGDDEAANGPHRELELSRISWHSVVDQAGQLSYPGSLGSAWAWTPRAYSLKSATSAHLSSLCFSHRLGGTSAADPSL